MIGFEVACTSDQIFTVAGLPTPLSTNVAMSSSCAEWTKARAALRRTTIACVIRMIVHTGSVP